MLPGVAIDELTDGFMRIATDRGNSLGLSQSLRVFFHDARNRLNSLKLGIYLARRKATPQQAGLWTALDQSYRGLEQFMERLQTVCRPAEMTPISSDLRPWLEDRRDVWNCWVEAGGRRLEFEPPPAPALGSFDPLRVILALDALVAWRGSFGHRGQRTTLSWRADETHLRICWSEEDVPLHADNIGEERQTPSLALPMLAHVMTAHGGSVAVDDAPGFVVSLIWPRESERN